MRFPFSLPLLCLTVLGLVLPMKAQDRTPVDRLITDLGRYCNRATEVSYRSQAIASSDGTRRVHIEGTLRKIIDPESTLRESDSDGYCYGNVVETVSAEVFIDGQRDTFELLDEPYSEGYLILEALSLSEDNRYLAAKAHVVHGGLSHEVSVAFFDLEAGEAVSLREVCTSEFNSEYDYTSHEGFLTPTTAVVLCSIFNSRTHARMEWYEAVDLASETSRVLSGKPDNLQDYGTVVGELEVTQVQEFKF